MPSAASPQTISSPDPASGALNVWLGIGVALRLLPLWIASPFNADRHFEVVQYILRHHALPTSNLIDQSYQPPLYYLLMAPLAAATGGATLPHAVTFALSCATIVLIRLAIGDPAIRTLVPLAGARVAAFALCATLPQFAICSGFISNDSLASLVGAGLFLLILSYARSPTRGRLIRLAMLVAVGLLTKGTLLLAGVALGIVVIHVERSAGRTWRATAGRVTAFCAIAASLGCYKYAENVARLGRPFVHNQDVASPTAMMQRNTWAGWTTAVDVNVLQLIRRPVIRAYDPPSYPLLLYGTFWYAYIPDRNYPSNLVGYDRIGSLTFAAAIVPTLTFALGVAAALRAARRNVAALAAVALLASNLAVVLAAGLKYDNWSSFHARLLFPSAGPIAVLFGIGLSMLWRHRVAGLIARAAAWGTLACGLLYLLVETLLYVRLIESGRPLQWW